jgi:hypothetical protein
VTVLLSGYLPGEDYQGLTALNEKLISDAGKKKRPEDLVVVGLLRRHTTKVYEDVDNDPQVTMRLTSLEVVGDEADAKYVRDLMEGIRESRTGSAPLPLDGAGEPTPLPGD